MKKDSFIFKATEDSVGQRIDKVLGQHEKVGSRSKAEFLITEGEVSLKGVVVKSSYRVVLGDEFQVHIPIPEEQNLEPFALELDIPFEDDHVIVVNKPAGLVVHPAAGHAADTLVNALMGRLSQFSMKFGENRPGIVHRIDKDTSGLLVIAKNDKAQENLVDQFKARTVERRYQALCYAPRLPLRGSFQSYLARHPGDRKKYASVRDDEGRFITEPDVDISVGKWAKTNYEILKRTSSGLALLNLKLDTGRTHQIRIHLAENGGPILADPIYGAIRAGSFSKKETDVTDQIPRLCLHAAVLGFAHPVTGEPLHFKARWPADIAPLLKELGFSAEMA